MSDTASQTARQGLLTVYGLYIAGTALMSSNPLFGRAAVGVVPPVGMAFWRWLIAFLIILPFALPGLLTHRRALLARWRHLLILGVLGQGISGAVYYLGLMQTSATNASLIYGMCPVIILVVARLWLGHPIALRQAGGILLAVAGVTVVLTRGDPQVLRHLTFYLGDLLILVAAVAWALYTILLRQTPNSLPVVTSFAANALSGALVLLPFYLWETLAGRPVPLVAQTVWTIGGMALFASVLSFVCYQKTIALMGPSRASTALYVAPLWTALAAWLLLGERLEPFHLTAALLILPGVALATLPARRPAGPRAVAGAAAED